MDLHNVFNVQLVRFVFLDAQTPGARVFAHLAVILWREQANCRLAPLALLGYFVFEVAAPLSAAEFVPLEVFQLRGVAPIPLAHRVLLDLFVCWDVHHRLVMAAVCPVATQHSVLEPRLPVCRVLQDHFV